MSRVSGRLPLLLFLLALGVRLVVLLATFDVPGDGPTRAIAAFEWARAPSFPLAGGWPPGFLFLSGSFEALVGEPLLSARILNLVLGSLTVPLLYLLVRRLYDTTAALASGAVLCFVPLHVGLSASSLTEASFLFELIAGTLLLVGPRPGAERDRFAPWRVALGVLSLVLASMTRYEAWPLLPLFVTHRFARTRSLRAAAVVAVALAAFPVAWSIGNYLDSGDPWLGFTAATSYIGITATPATFGHALQLLADWSAWQLGWVLPAAIVVGIGWELLRAARGGIGVDRWLYLALTGLQWLVLLRFAMVRGENVWTRYLVSSLVCALPFAFVPWSGAARAPSARRAAALAAVAILGLFAPWLGHLERAGGHWVTSRRPVEAEVVVRWLREAGRLDQPILLTPMEWNSPSSCCRHQRSRGTP